MTLNLSELERLEREATRDWRYEPDDEGSSMGWIVDGTGELLFDVRGDSAQQFDNAECAAAMRNALPELLSAARKLEKIGELLKPYKERKRAWNYQQLFLMAEKIQSIHDGEK